MQKTTLRIINEAGLHARPASELVKAASQFKSEISVRSITKASNAVNAKSILGILTLGVERGHEIELTVEGEDEVQAIQYLRQLIESGFRGKF